MATDSTQTLVPIYSTPNAFDAEIVKAMLSDEEITSTVENSSGPFPGLDAVPCQVLVAPEHEKAARLLIEEHEARLRERADFESETDEYLLPDEPFEV